MILIGFNPKFKQLAGRLMERLYNLLSSKPALKIAAPFIIGLILGNYIEAPPTALFLTLVITTMLAVLGIRSRITIGNFLLVLGLVSAGMLRLSIATQLIPANHIKYFAGTREKITILGHVTGYPQIKADGKQVEIQIDTLIIDASIYPVYGNALLRTINFEQQLHYGDRLKIYSKLREPYGERNPGGFDYRKFLNSQNIFALVTVSKPT
ncbi:MAG: ComEC/Rec2 family competence protein, partial [bacterium]|nr:ComEC/Rec2 family competence protein [bacterium]